ncbi:MAG TPA: YihA family ribosome biogenesis GTP-binding protein [Elusimicrobia bacterium]|nr:MAG: ribosome biogenesis GTP-binding protein YsxC [Elusimicrobia bacterium RIFOXYA12_FULL_49_49]OGS10787.1 MAG: ribosome biogenesis GTP-binding protein YsxC [Elusimicrobia bacterium RIFOXYB1_FULL_48_9]OGS16731.1 MAG: ribosome biogenesis GTP-binding protein YsxC [Elusimicrobia bacterium RIFOXYA2_FULL_47_53]OGS27013.1 MAG: ribosome biogenesis GTP-binding protein YsxC [Elusimicrobia bacterium RIFOXYB12_FULL_50_12]OGS31959.1 MAG: ribosome biogenesis GTP-binding protein YsxC [Elusimicrobia bacter
MTTLNKAKYYKTVQNPAEIEDAFAEVAFVGRSNVGKSSLLNSICSQKKLAFTSQRPGMTRSINIYSAAVGRWLVDLPGYGFAHGPAAELSRWESMIEGYLLSRETLRNVFVLVDAYVGATKLDREMVFWLQSNSIPYTIVANKCDKVKKTIQDAQRESIANSLGYDPGYIEWVSAEKNIGIRDLERKIAEILEIR